MEKSIKEKLPAETMVKKGYKRTKVGVIPEDWDVKKLDKEIELLSGNAFSSSGYSEKGIRLLRCANVKRGKTNWETSNTKYWINDDNLKKYHLKEGDLVIAMDGSLVGKSYALISSKDIPSLLLQRVARIRSKKINIRYLKEFIGSRLFIDYCDSVKTVTAIPHISAKDIRNFKIPLPPLPEQEKIAAILSTWDEGIQLLESTIKTLKKRNKGLAQQLLTGKLRLRSASGEKFDGEWVEKSLGELFLERKDIGFNDLPLLSIGEKGVYPQSDDNKKDSSNKDKSKYKRICAGDIGYNTMRMWQGRSALSNLEGIVSPAYTIVKPKKDTSSLFFAKLFKLDFMTNKFFRNSQGLVNDTLNCKYKDFKIVKVMAPSTLMEQEAIAKVLETADAELQLYQQKLNTLQEQKKGLMQKLLTGEVRVKV